MKQFSTKYFSLSIKRLNKRMKVLLLIELEFFTTTTRKTDHTGPSKVVAKIN